ncbi:MAG: hypothetical protein DRN25_07035, partial [Thermoplasmata archaeon]
MKRIRVTTLFITIIFLILLTSSPILAVNPDEVTDTITILTINDFHARVEPFSTEYGEETGGMPLIAGYIDYFRKGRKDVVWTIAGDHFQGTPIDSLTRGKALIKLLNLDPPDVFCLGNHEFDYGKDTLLKRIEEANFPIICANIVYEDTEEYFTTPYIIKDIDGVKTLFIGVICENLKSIITKGNAKGLKVLPVKETVEKIAKKFVNDVDLTVVISHIGYAEDIKLARNLSKECGVDVIIGGHSHTILDEATIENGVIIVQAGSWGEFVGKLDLRINLKKNDIESFGWKLLPVIKNKDIRPNAEVKRLTDEFITTINAKLDKEIGRVIITSIMEDTKLESALGNFSCDVAVKKLDVDIAFQNRGGLRAWIAEDGIIKIKNIWETFPFDNYWVKFRINAKQLWTIIETNAKLTGEYLMIPYTLSYKFDSSKLPGNRVVGIWFKGKKVEPHDDVFFECATCSFIWGHAEECFGLTHEEIIKNGGFKEIRGISYRDIYIDYVKEKGTIYLSTEGRVIDVSINDIPFLFLNLESGIIFNKKTINIEGYTDRNCRISVNNKEEFYPDKEGKFSVPISLIQGENKIYIASVNPLGNRNERKLIIFLDSIPPKIEISSPEDNFYTNEEKVNIKGSVSDSLSGVDKLKVNGEEVAVKEHGEFEKEITLSEGENEIEIEAVDKAGNKTEETLTVYLDKTPPELYVNIPDKVYNKSFITITGNVKDDLSGIASVKINGEGVKAINEYGRFEYPSLPLSLGSNTVVIEVIDKAGNKLEKEFTIENIQKIILKLQIGNRVMLVNDTPLEIDVPPTIVEGRTLLPIRWVAEPLGAGVSWDGKEKKVTVSLGDVFIELWIGKSVAKVNGK